MQIWREDFDETSTVSGAPLSQIIIRAETKAEAEELLGVFNGTHPVIKGLKKLIAERRALTNVVAPNGNAVISK